MKCAVSRYFSADVSTRFGLRTNEDSPYMVFLHNVAWASESPLDDTVTSKIHTMVSPNHVGNKICEK